MFWKGCSNIKSPYKYIDILMSLTDTQRPHHEGRS